MIVAFQAGYDELAPAARAAHRPDIGAARQDLDLENPKTERRSSTPSNRPVDRRRPKPIQLTPAFSAVSADDVAAARYSLVDRAVTDMHESDDDVLSQTFLP